MTTFTNNVIPEENTHYTCISAIDIDSVLKIDKKAFPQAYLEQCKYKLKEILIILKLLIMIVIVIAIVIVLVMLKLKMIKKLKVKKKLKIFHYLYNLTTS